MKEFFTRAIGLLRKHKRLWVVNSAFVAMFLIIILSILLAQPELIVCCFFLLIMISWEMSDIFLFEKQSVLQTELADAQDDLIVKEHEVERLTLELETAQAALVEAKKPNTRYSGYVQTGLAQVESSAIASSIDVAASEAPLPKPKRKPAPRGTRKQKTKNENKD